MRAIANFYLEYAIGKKAKGPANEEALKKHVRSRPDFILKNSGIDPSSIDSAFISERDQQPFVIIYDVVISQISGTSAPLIAHEQTGKNGKVLVVFANGNVELVNDARLQELKSAKL